MLFLILDGAPGRVQVAFHVLHPEQHDRIELERMKLRQVGARFPRAASSFEAQRVRSFLPLVAVEIVPEVVLVGNVEINRGAPSGFPSRRTW